MKKKLWNLWTSYGGLVLTLIAIACLAALLLSEVFLNDTSPYKAFITRIAGILLTGVLIQILLRYLVWKEAEASIFKKLGIRDEVRTSGFLGMIWYSEIPWIDLIDSCSTIEMFYTSNKGWTETHIGEIRAFLSEKGHTLTIILRTPDTPSLQGLAERFDDKTSKDRAERILGAAELLLDTYHELPQKNRGTLDLRHHPKDAIYTYYRFDDRAYFVPYILRPSLRAPEKIPALIFDTKGELYKRYLKEDFQYLRDNSELFTRELLEGTAGEGGA